MRDQYKGSEVILVVDDEPIILSLAKTILKLHGYEVHIAGDGAEALEIHRRMRSVDLLLTDVVMPRMSGPQLAHVLKEETENFRCVFMSGYDQDQIRQRGGEDIGCDFLRKPFTPDTLLKRIRETLDA
jgi:two-component system cell cycle sensor histidine kinase/response regulator CckA